MSASLVRFSSRKRRKPGASFGDNVGNLLFHLADVRGAIQLAAGAELNAILRVEPDHFHLLSQRCTGGLENLVQHARVEKEGRAEIKCEPVRLDG
jgi:hypothetical protein